MWKTKWEHPTTGEEMWCWFEQDCIEDLRGGQHQAIVLIEATIDGVPQILFPEEKQRLEEDERWRKYNGEEE
jgi:hypothetical protein